MLHSNSQSFCKLEGEVVSCMKMNQQKSEAFNARLVLTDKELFCFYYAVVHFRFQITLYHVSWLPDNCGFHMHHSLAKKKRKQYLTLSNWLLKKQLINKRSKSFSVTEPVGAASSKKENQMQSNKVPACSLNHKRKYKVKLPSQTKQSSNTPAPGVSNRSGMCCSCFCSACLRHSQTKSAECK